MNKYIKNIVPAVALLAMGLSSCVGDLDVEPIDPNLITTPAIEQAYNKCFANLALAGNSGPDGDTDIDGLDGGTSAFVRQLFNANELTTDEAICNWTNDEGIPQFNFNTYGASHPMLRGFYYRLTTGYTYCNNFLADYGGQNKQMDAEIRFLRALEYYFLMDCFGNVGFTETVSAENAPRYTRKQMYDWLEQELLTIEPDLTDAKPKTSTEEGYGRPDKAAVWMLLSRLYLNAEVYTGTAQWQKAADYAKKVIDSPYKLYTGEKKNGWTAYQQLFLADNGENGASVEAVLPIMFDGQKTAAYGGTDYLIAGCFDANVVVDPQGTKGDNLFDNPYWTGIRSRKSLIDKFFPNNNAPHVEARYMPEEAGDDRAIFDGKGGEKDDEKRTVSQETAEEVGQFVKGFAVAKFVNFYASGATPHALRYPDNDFFLFRVAEAYLTYAEATARQNGGNTTAEGTAYINQIRARAHTTTRTGSYTLRDIMDEWSREFYFEGRRRTDLIRFNCFGGDNNYNWPWKGGVAEGKNFSANRNIFAIPTTDLLMNTNLIQNTGY